MRPFAALALAALLVLAGCNVPFTGGAADNGTDAQRSPDDPATTAPGTEAEAEASTGIDGASAPPSATQTPVRNITDPPQDMLGWEGGYWYNGSIRVTARDGLNASEQRAVVNRTMARIERIRQLEYNRSVTVEVISREELQNRPGTMGGDARSPAFRTFDNAKFEGLFLIGEEKNSLSVQQSNRGQNVLGYYSPGNDSIVIVSETETPRLSRSTLAHELVHALQDQQFGLASVNASTRESYNARNGLVEGEANYVQRRYAARCDGQWRCLDLGSNASASNRSTDDLHLGVYALQYFPYADGPKFVDFVYEREGWQGVNALYRDVPQSTEQIIHPQKYRRDAPTNVTIRDRSSAGWERVSPGGRPDYAVLGQSALSSMFAYTLYDEYNRSSVVSPTEFLNTDGPERVNRTDPFNYGLNYTDGWDGDRMYVYQRDNETGYVWRLTWDSPRQAREFIRGYRQLLTHWGGERVLGRQGVWEVDRNSPFTDAFSVRRDGDTVTIVNGPQAKDLSDIHAPNE